MNSEENLMNRKKTHKFTAKNEEDKSVHRGFALWLMSRKYIPKGKMGHPKWSNGTSQMVKWDIPNGEMGHPKWQNGIPQMVKWDIPKGKMGYPKW